MLTNNFTEKLFFSTVRIELPDHQTMGTGFICERKAKNGLNYHFLVTNKHVIENNKDQIKLVFHINDLKTNTPLLGQTFPVQIQSIDNDAYFQHPNKNVDLACLNISPVFNQRNDLFWATVMPDFIADYKKDKVLAGSEVFFVGYPSDRYDRINNLPILRSGKIASLPQVDFENQPSILIDAHVYKGSSGSPVFSICEGNYKLIGILYSGMLRDQEVEVSDKNIKASFKQLFGIGLVIKSDCITELLDIAVKTSDSYHK